MKAFVLLGQSNMSGRGVIGDLPAIRNENVYALRNGEWAVAEEPIVRDRPFSGEGMTLTFGDTINKLTGESVGLIPCSLGGTSLDQWAVGGELYSKAIAACRDALKTECELAGILWHQGETDSDVPEHALNYLGRLNIIIGSFISDLRRAADEAGRPDAVRSPLPVIVGELGDYLLDRDDSKYYAYINEQLHVFAGQRREYACVNAHDLGHKGDGLHFSTRSLRRLGIRYAEAYLCAVDAAPSGGIN